MRRAHALALATAAVGLAAYPIATSLAAPGPQDGWLGQRPLLSSLSADDQKLLASLIDKYTSANSNAVIKVHENTMNDPKLQNVHYRNFAQLFTFHHQYISGLEDWLKAQGYSKFVPLPKWQPTEPIPQVFGYHNGKKVIKNFKPNVDWSAFVHSKLGAFEEDITSGPKDNLPDAKILANTLVVPHNNTHNTVGGIMSTMSSPTAPIFWVYHAFIDDIWYDWQQVQKNTPKSKGALEAAPYDPEAIRSLEAKVRVDANGNVFLDRVGTQDSFPVTAEPWKSILASRDGKSLWVQGKVDGANLAVDNLITNNESMGPVKVHSGPALADAQNGTLTGMSEVHVTGESGDFWKVRLDDTGKTGFVAKSVVSLGKGSGDSGMHMDPNMPMGSMPMGSSAGSSGTTAAASGEKDCACCGTGSSCTCCGASDAAGGSSKPCACGMDMPGHDAHHPESGITDGVKKTTGE